MRSHFVLTAGAALFAASTVDAVSPCCTTLANLSGFRQKVFFPESEIYNERLESIFSLSARQAPWCVVLPESTQDASEIMKTVSKLKCPFGIRSGGHGMHLLSNSVEGGITIDFDRMNTTNYDKQKGIVSIGPGMRSGHIYHETMDDGVVITAGRVAPVGAAGFIAGGGISYHWPSHGWGCDNVINYEIMLANGTIVNANEQQNRDLWVAQRGSSGNFGLITRYDMRAIPYANPKVPLIWAGAIEYDWSAKGEFVNRWVAFTKRHALDMNSSSMFQFQYDTASDKWQLATILSNTANIANATTLQPIISMDKQLGNGLRSDTMGNFTREFFADVNDKYHIWFTSTYTVDPKFILYTQEQHQLLVQQLRAALPKGTQFTSLTTHHAITPTVVSHSKGNNVLGLEKRVANNTVGHMFLIWVQLKTAQDEAIALPIVQAWHKKLGEEGTKRGINWNWEYLNYAHGLQDPIRTYGEENVGKLRKASEKYDPEGVFQTLRGSGFKIPVN